MGKLLSGLIENRFIALLGKYAIMGGNTLLKPLDRLFEKKGDSRHAGPLFIAGVPRSGTTLLYQLLTQCLEVGYLTNLTSHAYGCGNLINRLLKSTIIGKSTSVYTSRYGFIKGLLSPSEYGRFWFQWFPEDGANGQYVQQSSIDIKDYRKMRKTVESWAAIFDRPLLFKCLYLNMTIGALAAIFPNARFIHIERDLLTVCKSLYTGRIHRRNPRLWWSVKVPHYKDKLSKPLWKQITEQVYETDVIIKRDLKRYADQRYISITYEKLCRKTPETVDRLIDWLGEKRDWYYEREKVPESFDREHRYKVPEDICANMKNYLNDLMGA